MSFRRRFSLLLGLGIVITAGLEATTAIQLSDLAMTEQAELIVVGRVESSRVQWIGRTLVTLATVSVTEVLKGSAGPTVNVTLPGGIDAQRKVPIAMSYPGAPQLAPGEQVFLFLITEDLVAGSYSIVGFSQGKFTIEEAGEIRTMSRNLQGMKLQNGRRLTGGGRTIVSLDEFKSKIQGYLKSAATPAPRQREVQP